MKKIITDQHQKRLSELGCYFRELRFNENMSQKEVCQGVNLHQNTLQRIENGSNYTLLALFEIADFYSVPISEILSDIE